MSDKQSEFENLQMPDTFLAEMFKTQLVLIDGEQFAKKPAPTLPPTKKVSAPAVPITEKPKSIILPPAPLAEKPASQAEQPAVLSQPPHASLGAFKKKVLILHSDPKAVHISEENLAFLSKVIAAVGISLEHIALLNVNGKKVEYGVLKTQFPAKVAIYFGVEPASIGVPMKFPLFQVQQWDECRFLYAPSLTELDGKTENHTEMKTQLWTSLKKIFS